MIVTVTLNPSLDRTTDVDVLTPRRGDSGAADGSIIVDAGTTTARFVQVLPTDRELTVIVRV